MTPKERRLIIISGLSGAGKTIALNTLEDLGIYCIDNLPVSLLADFVKQINKNTIKASRNVAVGIDARNPKNEIEKLPAIINELRKGTLKIELVYIEASDDTLTRRFSETRRKHPLTSKTVSLPRAISKEKKIMEDLSDYADIRIDTSHVQLYELRDIVRKRVANRPVAEISLQFISFGYKHGIPRDADFVFDSRCLPNPYWNKNLHHLTGKDKPVIKFLSGQMLVTEMINQIRDFLKYWIPKFESNNRIYLSAAIGCTGGQHRSVFITDQLSSYFRKQGKHVITIHRDI